ncbi:MAG TPA: DUF1295 domain-containing protein [Myxococcota bacterium]
MDHALLVSIWICVAAIVGCLVLSVINDNYSQVDRLWSIIPIVYVAWFASQADFADARLNLMTALVTAWGARLTFNFARKGGYKPGGEDYRWPVLRDKLGRVGFQIFNATFISPYQNALLLLICLPAWVALSHKGTPLNVVDVVAAVVFVVALVGEFVADQQQWDFHKKKDAARANGQTLEPPFLTTGLWKLSRHPNFVCEQTQWWCVALFGIAAATGGQLSTVTSLPWPALAGIFVGAVLLTLLFQGSSWFTEYLTVRKYPSYADWQKQTPRQFPLPIFKG